MRAFHKALLSHVVFHVSHNEIRMLPIKRTHLTLVALSLALIFERGRHLFPPPARQTLPGRIHLVVRVQNLVLLQVECIRGIVVAVAAPD